MSLVWAIPVVAAALAVVAVALAAHPLADEAAGLVADVRRLRELRRPLAATREVLGEAGALVAEARAPHAPGGPGAATGSGPAPGPDRRPGAPPS
jgi:hypothetical protein